MADQADITTRADLELIVERFYARAMTDAHIGHFFTEVVSLDLREHLPVIVNFWESVLLGHPVYRGNPMLKHLHLDDLSPLEPEHFRRWLALWRATVEEHFSGERADLAVRRATDIARLMEHKINMKRS
ncbi:group III truncated hemoglobin [Lewinella sp. W8]|uniref:group III truncated hemoglobin n=1 Tax=Lewinella sp. W8 TaxID=2528208 RepID=UPI001067A65E|nr:group III truncated hemoglobin [Lewinella sp. W8]MTB49648.1 sec-independent protein translocase TatC [Lewinella sp. W8]